jgi:hypothetical protein
MGLDRDQQRALGVAYLEGGICIELCSYGWVLSGV